MPAYRFIKETLSVARKTPLCILHTRAATQGHESNNHNNHPIVVRNQIIGVHNGMVYNDSNIFRDLGIEDRRIAEVDSEAIFAALAYGGEKYVSDAIVNAERTRIKDYERPIHALAEIEGSASVAWMDVEDRDVLHLSRIWTSPLVWAQTTTGSLVFASTWAALGDVEKAFPSLTFEHFEEAKEGEYLRVRQGRIEEYETFTPASFYSARWGSYAGYGYFGGTTNRGNETTEDGHTADEVSGVGSSVTGSSGTTTSTCGKSGTDIESITARILMDGWEDQWSADSYLSKVEQENYYRAHKQREEGIDAYLGGLDDGCDIKTWWEIAADLAAFARPGEWVGLTLAGNTGVFGQLWELPESFPHGEYVVRCFVPNNLRNAGHEVVFVARHHFEFNLVDPTTVPGIIREYANRRREMEARRNAGRPKQLEAAV